MKIDVLQKMIRLATLLQINIRNSFYVANHPTNVLPFNPLIPHFPNPCYPYLTPNTPGFFLEPTKCLPKRFWKMLTKTGHGPVFKQIAIKKRFWYCGGYEFRIHGHNIKWVFDIGTYYNFKPGLNSIFHVTRFHSIFFLELYQFFVKSPTFRISTCYYW